jgi:fructokinase
LQVSAVDTVGAGDSLLDGKAQEVALERACRIGAFVATKQGATPRHDAEGIKALKRK